MKKILLVGEMNQIMGSLNTHLATKFQTQICMNNLDVVKAMLKVYRPDLVVLCLVGATQMDSRILDLFSEKYQYVPMMFIGTAEECAFYQNKYDNEKYEYVIRPTTLGRLLSKCEEILIEEEDRAKPEAECEVKEESASGKKCILAVDDSGIFLRTIKNMLDEKYDVVVANSGQFAMKQAKKRIPDLILLDYEMPEWDGRRTLIEIRNDEELKDIPVVFLTGVSDKPHITAVLALKPSGYLLKPIDPQRLFETIEEALIEI